MSNILLITSSPRGEASLSTKVATQLAESLGGTVTTRATWKDQLDPLTPEKIGAFFTPEDARTEEQILLAKASDDALAELFAADVLVIGAGMINFGVPATLKNWIDHIARAGKTFKYTETGPVGLVTGKKAYLVLAAGGIYSDGPFAAYDHLKSYLQGVLGFIGITDVETIWVEGVAMGEDATAKAIAAANDKIASIAASL